ncbi:MAG: methyltransferase [bacterium]
MNIYKLETIQNTEKYVIEELKAKFPDINIVSNIAGEVEFETNIEDIDEFRSLLSPLRIQAENGIIRNLFRREWRKEFIPAGINPSLAFILCKIADIKENDVVLDPFCGGGTIPISAMLYFNPARILASDISGKAIDITQANIATANIQKSRYGAFRSDVKALKLPNDYIDKIITNLPFGIRVGKHDNNEKIYYDFANKAKKILKKDGTIVVLTQEKNLMLQNFNEFRLIEHFMIRQGGLTPWVFVYKKGK